MSAVGMMQEKKDRPAFVRFVRRPIEDRTVKSVGGRYPKKDVDFALVTPPYSKDCFEAVASEWLEQMRQEVQLGRLPEDWCDRYAAQYEKWLVGEEMPLDGEAIKGWGVISPAQQANLIAINIRTVEDLAAVNDEGLKRIGMGAGELRDKAKAWLSQLADKGPLTQENALLKGENFALKAAVTTLEGRVKELAERVEILQRGGLLRSEHFPADRELGGPAEGISASDILQEVPEQPRRQSTRKAAEKI
jgi:hypothetical protein